jgi:glycosyltransferase involved in cell wall biosynthesis
VRDVPRVEAFLLGTATPGGMSGGDRHALEVLDAWGRSGRASVTLYVAPGGAETVQRFEYSVATHVLPEARGLPLYAAYLLRLSRALRAPRRGSPPAVVYATSAYFYDALPAWASARRARALLVVALFHVIPVPWRRQGFVLTNLAAWLEQRLMIALVVRRAGLVVVDNPEVRADLVRLGVRTDRIVVSSMGVRRVEPCGTFTPVDATYVGRLTEQKGLRTLIRAWRSVVDVLPTAQLRLIGQIDRAFPIRRLLEDERLAANVEILEGLSDGEVVAALQSTRAFVTASEEEGYGLSVLEALAAGIPVVAFDLPAFRFAFPRGRIVARSGADGLGETLRSVLTDEECLAAARAEVAAVAIPRWDDVADEIWERLA